MWKNFIAVYCLIWHRSGNVQTGWYGPGLAMSRSARLEVRVWLRSGLRLSNLQVWLVASQPLTSGWLYKNVTVLASPRPGLIVSGITGNQTVWPGAGQRHEIFPHGVGLLSKITAFSNRLVKPFLRKFLIQAKISALWYFSYVAYFVSKWNFLVSKMFFLNPNKKYSSYQRMCEFEFVEFI